MQDKRGTYYYPNPSNKRIRMYVREMDDVIAFRLWNEDVPQLWEEHGWVPYDAIQKAAAMFTGKNFDPHQAYDIELAKAALKEEK